ncbi:U-box domain-containing protein 35 isoform X1 [Primulina huaijiensis]|uniref:U-box domain-containing protein 35 isoform X1 n=2 Tax=Primulina huaijiensis TaxID=1492673 RepID=UPI003CC75D55
MEGNKYTVVEGLDELPPLSDLVVAVALSGGKKDKYTVKWALEKFVPEQQMHFKLIHVRPKISRIPTPMGNYIPISGVRDDVAAAYRKDIESQVNEKLLPYKKICSQKKVRVEIEQIESDDVVSAISEEIRQHMINKLVIGVSSRPFFSRAQTLSSKISGGCPSFCTVYAVSKGKLASLRPSDSKSIRSTRDDGSDASCFTRNSSSSQTSFPIATNRVVVFSESTKRSSSMSSMSQIRSSSLPVQRFQTSNKTSLRKRIPSSGVTHSISSSLAAVDERNDFSDGSDINEVSSQISSCRSSTLGTPPLDQASTSEASAENQANINFELEKLRIELRHVRGMYAMAQGEAIEASRKLNELHKRHLDEENTLKQVSLKEEELTKLARQEKERYEAAKREADYANERAEREAAERKLAEVRASRETREKENLENALMGSFYQYRKFTWEEIISATSTFSENLKLGNGAYGTVYKGIFHHITAAVKILHAKEASRTKQFLRELEILSQIRHPHLLILLGACPDHACLVYEFMENGNLEDRLLKKNNTPPLLWFDRYRIAWEVASALVFLHNSKPNAIIHRDLKPANILLDHNYVSKIGDVGLSEIVNEDSFSMSMNYKDTTLVGTLGYFDPEYQRTGQVSPKSDVYALGIVILQLLTAKPAKGLAHIVEVAMEKDCFIEVLDQVAGAWPIEETEHLARMALKCTELKGSDRPDLHDQVLPALEKLKEVVERARKLALPCGPPPPNHFICPILKEIMTDPCVAADGYTYERMAIEAWLEKKNTSPKTNLPFPNKSLTPNYTLLSAIMEWKSGKYQIYSHITR